MPYYCEFCGRELNKKIVSHGHVFCSKHYRQFKKYGKVLDNNPRTTRDRNEYYISGDCAYITLYDNNSNPVAQTIIDAEDLDKVKYTKWGLSKSGYVINTPKFSGKREYISHVILKTDQFVNYINHNKLDNRKSNLRIATRSQIRMNSNSKGVHSLTDGRYYAQISFNRKTINLGVYVFEEEALFARWYAETLLFGEYRYPKEKPYILPDREKAIMDYVEAKVQRL